MANTDFIRGSDGQKELVIEHDTDHKANTVGTVRAAPDPTTLHFADDATQTTEFADVRGCAIVEIVIGAVFATGTLTPLSADDAEGTGAQTPIVYDSGGNTYRAMAATTALATNGQRRVIIQADQCGIRFLGFTSSVQQPKGGEGGEVLASVIVYPKF
jgi:hypothetical protein